MCPSEVSYLSPSGNTVWWLHKISLQNYNTLAFALENVIQSNTHLVVVQSLSLVWLFATPWTIAHQAPLSMGFSRQEYWSGLPCPSPGDLPDPGINPSSPALAGGFFTAEPPGNPIYFSATSMILKSSKLQACSSWDRKVKVLKRELKYPQVFQVGSWFLISLLYFWFPFSLHEL